MVLLRCQPWGFSLRAEFTSVENSKTLRFPDGIVDFDTPVPNGPALIPQWTSIIDRAIGEGIPLDLESTKATIVAYETTSSWDGKTAPDSQLRRMDSTVAALLFIGQRLATDDGKPNAFSPFFVGSSAALTDVFVFAGWAFKDEEIVDTELIDWP